MSEEVFDWNISIAIKIKEKTRTEIDSFITNIKTQMENALAAGTINSANMRQRRSDPEEEWYIPNVT